MVVRVLFFGATAADTGKRDIVLDLGDPRSVDSLYDKVLETFPKLRRHKLLYSLNQTYATGDEIVRDGDEIAIFTAVSGG